MQRRVRQFLWVLVVAGLVGVFWPERPSHPLQTTAVEEQPTPHLRLPGATAAPSACDACGLNGPDRAALLSLPVNLRSLP